MLAYLWLIPLLPLIGAILNAALGYRLGRGFVNVIAPAMVGLSFVAAVAVVWGLAQLPSEERVVEQTLYRWLTVGDLRVDIALRLDALSAVMILVVTGVGLLIHIYSAEYMGEDAGYARYFGFLNFFVFAMLLLVLANNFALLYIGWELVGLSSYLLIGFWFQRPAAAAAAKKAFVVNRVGDVAFLLGIFFIFWTFGTLNYTEVFVQAQTLITNQGLEFRPDSVGASVITIIPLLLLGGAIAKSAQLPLYVWLPDAMEGPTPVSALIHAATMVTAGVYLITRTNPLFALSPFALDAVAVIGTASAIFAATIALVQTDMKRVMAYSTISQLGYMFLGLGVGAYAAAIFHLVMHAFFKALLFLSAGSVMHALAGETDMRKMGALASRLRVTALVMTVGALALAGIPPFAGFFSKDAIVAAAVVCSPLLGVLALLTGFVTALYAFRMVFLIFAGPSAALRMPRGDMGVLAHAHEPSWVMKTPLIILALLATFAGLALGLPLGSGLIENFIEPVFETTASLKTTVEVEILVSVLAASLGALGIFAAWRFYGQRAWSAEKLRGYYPWLYELFARQYFVEDFYRAMFVQPYVWVAGAFAQQVDIGIIDGAANGVGAAFRRSGKLLSQLQTGVMRLYALAMIIGIVLVIALILVGGTR